ncbi:uncharacterized protein FOMMEDRAFT_159783 [Fomitiporia mediterranea MF3/22]|uniref:uncharacterized protein n=1 Tax=Fomitiporia mediterranea (strain MF3/22) TaxID=694068 RepID=UPI000440959F|nr:uncharacterized protein FOMMEDRAFT_159783 [Fomitiporia mediterranea MF3/22]EJD00141.1 hypothetical protein FOMMEDRAFT_159783 [Fomitiporia mediterranea MF3/22]
MSRKSTLRSFRYVWKAVGPSRIKASSSGSEEKKWLIDVRASALGVGVGGQLA